MHFDGNAIQYTYNNSNDKYAGNRGREKDVCTEIIKKDNEQGEVEFFISGCSKGYDRFLISVEKDILMNK